MKKLLISCVMVVLSLGAISPANAHGGRWHGGGWVPFAAGAVTGVVIARGYYRPAPIYYYHGSPMYYYPPQPMVAFCPENGLYYPQTQACPSGWQALPN